MLTDDQRRAAADRRAAIGACVGCDETGWAIGLDGRPIDPARRCDHQDPAPEPRYPN